MRRLFRPGSDPFAAFADTPRWLPWREEQRIGRPGSQPGKPTKMPYSARRHVYGKSTDPATWGTHAEAKARAEELNDGRTVGCGIVLGDLGDQTYLAGADLDSSIEHGVLADWAVPIVSAVDSYAEISPSGRGLKSFFYIAAEDVRWFLERIGVAANDWGCKRGIPGLSGADHGPGIELYCSGRFFTVTGRQWSADHPRIELLGRDKLEAVAALLPKPTKLVRPGSSPAADAGNGDASTRDFSRSGRAWRAAFAFRDTDYETMCEGLRNHDDPEIREWVREKGEPQGERELRRLWERGVVGEGVQIEDDVPSDTGPRPVVQVSGGELPKVIDLAEEFLIARDPDIFAFGDQIVRPAIQPIRIADNKTTRGLRLVPIAIAHMTERFTRHVDFQKYNMTQKKWLPIDCPRPVAEAYLQRIGLWRLNQLSALTTCPLLLPDGRVLERPGYDADSGLLFDPQGVAFPPVPNEPSPEEGRVALDQLQKPFGEFPFIDDKAKSVLWSALLSSVSRLAVPFVPCHAFDAPVARTGKSKLVDCCSILLTGRECAVVSQAADDTEFKKMLGAILLAGDPLVSIDNCTEAIDNQFLCQMVTQRLVQFRILGFSKNAIIPNNALLFATGNNFRFGGDMLYRGLVGRLDAGIERPQLRVFKTEDPIIVLKRDRPRYVVAALTVLRSYIHAGQPEPGIPLGGFEGWSRLVRDCLVWLGEEDPVQTIEIAHKEDPKLLQLQAVITQWEIHLGRRRVSTKDIIDVALQREGFTDFDRQFCNPELRLALMAVAGNDGRIETARLGNWLRTHKDQVDGNRRIILDGAVDGVARWRLQHFTGRDWE